MAPLSANRTLPHLILVLVGLSHYYLQQNEIQKINELGEPLLTLAEQQHDRERLMLAYQVLLYAAYWGGNFSGAHKYAKLGMHLYDPHQHSSLEYTLDLAVTFLSLGAWALWYLGYPDQALRKSQRAVAVARDLRHPYSLAWALNATSWTHWYRGEGYAACSFADEAVALSTTQDFPHWLAMGQWMRGQALIELGQWEEGTVQLRQGLEAYQATGALLGVRGCGLTELAKGYGYQGQIKEGLRMITEAVAEVNQVRHYAAEMYRIKGELTLQQFKVQGSKFKATDPRSLTPDPQGEAEACFLQAIDIARQQQAKSWELRAATSLAHLWQQQGKKEEAYKLLSEIYGWFTEGFDTKDLQEAKALLEKLEESKSKRTNLIAMRSKE